MKLLRFCSSILPLISLFICTQAMAARDGQIDTESSGEISVRLEIKRGIQISNLEDIQISVSNQANEDIVLTEAFCVRSNEVGSYSIAVVSDQVGSSDFSISSADRDQINFDLYFKGDMSDAVGDKLSPNSSSRQYALEPTGADCDGSNNAEISLQIPAEQINSAKSSEYDGFLNLTVAIE
jgi:hypothetical protein